MIICDEMKKLREGLDERHIPWEDKSDDDNGGGYWICRTHFRFNGNRWSVINGFGTYGGFHSFTWKNNELLECMTGNEEPVGWLMAKDVFEMMEVEE